MNIETIEKSNYTICPDGTILGQGNRPLKPRLKKDGYHYVRLSIDGKVKEMSVHRLVALVHMPNPKGKPQVNHIDGDKLNNHETNLEWVTREENMVHAYLLKLIPHHLRSKDLKWKSDAFLRKRLKKLRKA